MVTTPHPAPVQVSPTLTITWEKLPDDVPLEDEPVESTAQPLIAGALRESLELSGYLKPESLVASNLGLCATLNDRLVIKAPDWLYVASVQRILGDRRSYTPNLEGAVPRIVMEFLSHTEGEEYSAKPTFPVGKWFFYEQILKVPIYVLFAPDTGELEVYQHQNSSYEVVPANAEGRYWLADLKLFLGVWFGDKEARSGFWLRWWDEAGNLLPWAVEKVGQERDRAEQERNRADRLAEYLRSQGIDPDAI